jgi:hypothetical protein
MSVVAAFLSL